jgi:integrase
MYAMFESFYENKSNITVNDVYSLRLSERCRKEYHAVILNKFIPFLKLEKITCFEQLTATSLNRFQDHLLAGKMKPQTVNNNLKAVKRMLASLTRKGILQENPGERIKGIPVNYEDKKTRGCYELDKLKSVFNKRWKDDTSQLLCLLIYTTGMRNSEINRIRLEDIINIEGCHFIQVKKSKTPSGIRMVPLHELVYRKLKAWAAENKRTPQSILFNFRRAEICVDANSCLRKQIGVSEAEAAAENITFYSGRHFWKTLMNSEGLGEDIEEIFMGHKVTSNVAKLYNHRDKQGKKMMAQKAKQVFSILDRCLFNIQP